MARELEVETAPARQELPGPLRILVAISAPRGELDQERELGVILDAAEKAGGGNCRIKFVEEEQATLDAIALRLESQRFHVLHVSAHGREGRLELEVMRVAARRSVQKPWPRC